MEKQIKIALAGNPNCGKTTLFNALTGSNQFVGNWPGVTVEKKEGRLKKHDDVVIMDLPGIYSLSPYTLEEVVARNYLIDERPDAILNIVDGTNLERNLYLTTQLTELGIPVVMAVNMMDIVRKSGDQINISQLSQQLNAIEGQNLALPASGLLDKSYEYDYADNLVARSRQRHGGGRRGVHGLDGKAIGLRNLLPHLLQELKHLLQKTSQLRHVQAIHLAHNLKMMQLPLPLLLQPQHLRTKCSLKTKL